MPKSLTSSPINNLHTPEAIFQRRIRIRLALAACAYEFYNESIMSDGEFDELSMKVDTNIETGNPDMDWFFSEEFNPSTGQWVHKHPELPRLKQLYEHLRFIGAFIARNEDGTFDI